MDFEKVIGDMLSEMKVSVGENATETYALLTQYVENNKDFIEKTTTYLKNGEISLEEFTEIMKDNAMTLESEMLNLEIQKKKAIQDALDAGMKVLLKAADVVV